MRHSNYNNNNNNNDCDSSVSSYYSSFLSSSSGNSTFDSSSNNKNKLFQNIHRNQSTRNARIVKIRRDDTVSDENSKLTASSTTSSTTTTEDTNKNNDIKILLDKDSINSFIDTKPKHREDRSPDQNANIVNVDLSHLIKDNCELKSNFEQLKGKLESMEYIVNIMHHNEAKITRGRAIVIQLVIWLFSILVVISFLSYTLHEKVKSKDYIWDMMHRVESHIHSANVTLNGIIDNVTSEISQAINYHTSSTPTIPHNIHGIHPTHLSYHKYSNINNNNNNNKDKHSIEDYQQLKSSRIHSFDTTQPLEPQPKKEPEPEPEPELEPQEQKQQRDTNIGNLDNIRNHNEQRIEETKALLLARIERLEAIINEQQQQIQRQLEQYKEDRYQKDAPSMKAVSFNIASFEYDTTEKMYKKQIEISSLRQTSESQIPASLVSTQAHYVCCCEFETGYVYSCSGNTQRHQVSCFIKNKTLYIKTSEETRRDISKQMCTLVWFERP